METFTYTDGKIICSNGWEYDFQLIFRASLIVYPKFQKMRELHADPKIPEGAFILSRTVMELADEDYKTNFETDGAYSDFGGWLKLNRRRIWEDAAKWFDLPALAIPKQILANTSPSPIPWYQFWNR
jgi:hypothetical protein